ncbi:lanthionine synthetase C family protein [bacterium]|nr:lanthionine synthetase C family protein [bacterium]
MIKRAIIDNLNGIKKFIWNNHEIKREDRLWPADFKVFTTNPLNIAYGACGIIEFLLDINVDKKISNKFYNWVLNHEINDNIYPPGLYVGLSGIAWVLEEGGFKDEAVKIMDMANKSRLLFDNPNVFYGVSGVGMTNLHFWYKFKDQKYLDMAYELGDYLVNNYGRINDVFFWNNEDRKIYFGYAHGSCGIALFLLYLYLAEKKEKYLEIAMKYLDFDISHLIVENDNIKMFSGIENKKNYFPYWEFGNAGLILVLLRFYKITANNDYRKLAIKAANFINVRFTSSPGLFMGLAAIGESYIDLYQFLDVKNYYNIAIEMAENTIMYSIEFNKGIIYPGQQNLRLSCDYATGSSGIGIFLNRLIDNKGRKFVNDYLLEE